MVAASSVTTSPAAKPLPSPSRTSTTKNSSAPGGWPATCIGQLPRRRVVAGSGRRTPAGSRAGRRTRGRCGGTRTWSPRISRDARASRRRTPAPASRPARRRTTDEQQPPPRQPVGERGPRASTPSTASSSAGTRARPDARVPLGVQRRERARRARPSRSTAGTAIASTSSATATSPGADRAAAWRAPACGGPAAAVVTRRAIGVKGFVTVPAGARRGRRLRVATDARRLRPRAAVPRRGGRPCAACCRRVPDGFAVIVVDNGSRDDTAEVARALGRAWSCEEPRPGTAPRCTPGSLAATADYVAVMDGDGSFDPADLLPLLDEVAGRPRRPGGRAPAPGRAAACGRGTPAPATRWSLVAAPPDRPAGARHRADAGLPPRRPARPRRARTAASATPSSCCRRRRGAGWRIAEHDVAYHPRAAGTRSKVSGSVRGHACAPPATSRGCCREAAPRAGRRQGAGRRPGRRPGSAPHVGTDAAAELAAAALLDTLAACRARSFERLPRSRWPATWPAAVRGDELVAALAGWTVHPQRGDGFAERLANAHADVAAGAGAPVVQIGMDTPQRHRRRADRGRRPVGARQRRRARPRRGRRLVGARASPTRALARPLARRADVDRHGRTSTRWRPCGGRARPSRPRPCCATSTPSTTPTVAAAAAPDTRFAPLWREPSGDGVPR